MAENGDIKKIFCLDCKKELYFDGLIIGGWLRTDGDQSIKKSVPGGLIIGKELGYVCDDCSVWGKEQMKKNEKIEKNG